VNRLDVFSPLVAFPLAYIAWFVIGSIDFIQLPSFMGFGAFDPIPGRVPLYAGIGLGGYLLGAATYLRSSNEREEENAPASYRWTWEPVSFRLALLVLIFVMVGTYAYIGSHIGLPILSPNAGEARLELGNYHWAGTPFFASAYTVIFLLLVKIWSGSSLLGSKTRWLMVGALAAIFLVFLSMAGRAILVPPILTGVILYHYVKKTLGLKSLVVGITLLFAALSVFGYLRDLTLGDGAMSSMEDAGLPRSVQPFVYCYLYIRYSVATLRDVSAIIPSQAPYQYGAITSLPFRSVLPGHHEMADVFFKNLVGNEFIGAGQPATILGAFYSDFGPAGIFVEMFLWGLLLARLYRWMRRERSVFSAMIFAWVTQASLFGIFGGVFTYLDTLMIPLCWALLNFLVRTGRTTPARLALS
jgi:oligosaccharide repeat unit polymerase